MSSVSTRTVPAGLAVSRAPLRWLAPSLCDLFLVAVIGWSFLTSGTGWGRLLWDGDTAMHTAIGELILDQGKLPSTDPFSFTMPGAAWLPWEWGSGVLFAELNRAFGIKAVAFVCGVIIAATIAILLRSMLAAGANMFIAVVLALLASNALSLHYHARPHVFTLLLLAIAGWILTLDRERPSRRIWLIPAMAALDANLHPGVVMLVAVLGAITVGTALEWIAGAAPLAAVKRYAVLLAATVAALLANPLGVRLPLHILSSFSDRGVLDLTQEWQAPTFRSVPQQYFLFFLLAGLLAAGALLARRRFAEPLMLLGLAFASLTSLRHSTVFVVVAAPILARELSAVWQGWVSRQPRSSAARILEDISEQRRDSLNRSTVWSLVALVAIALWTPATAWPAGFDPAMFPVQMAARHPELTAARVFTSDQWADYLVYANYPRQKIFYDDRMFYGARMYAQASDLLSGKPGSAALLDQYGADSVLIETGSSTAALLASDPKWKRADQDKTAVLFLRAR